jgi:heptaprenyl diphosphate synthase
MMVNMLAATLQNSSSQALCSQWGALIEMMHISSLAHDDIIDDSPSRRGVQSQHLRYGKRSAVFSANFTIAKAYV